MSAAYLTDACRTLNESKGLEFNDVGLTFLRVYLIADKTKILLYNFFKDSTASLNQWRLVLNDVSNGDNPLDAPAFEETCHASVCVEVCCLRPRLSFPFSLMLSGSTVEILVRCNYSGPEKPLDRGRFRVSRTDEGA